ncbi:hemagglutinin [Flavobacterium columnare]|uniref:Peptidoglycan hydrolase n=1 Tax=Flavobacterium columnare TaxID=996 RepID=A0AAI8CID2_9FLAO|nr:glucosaminidase domain-containing protein [Flavobacterium columnare]AMO21294.1 LysM peptidoglycan-binding domain-containing protein [Flavobacterium columnare]ANO47755.1 muramidase [Flavobacterium columnare]APT21635.1 hemagglutinin [Flavobacterium columnare]AUX19317.1 hemagglutinin [Flavobacterium columnare]MBF6652174.1 LysM peptidoglycan-binding domain-containing protein [Flavobacterium columnare]
MKKIIHFFLVLFLVSCGASKPTIQTTKKIVHPTNQKKGTQSEKEITKDQNLRRSEELVATSKVKVTPEIVNGYVMQFKEVAMNNMKEHKVPASIILAQGILESGAGTGTLCRTANNHFGIKCHKEWTGEYVRYDDDAAQECFRKYQNPSHSYRDHSLFLTSRSWYAPLFKLDPYDYKGWAYGLKKSGYATDPKYPEKLISIIERYKLHEYDSKVLGFVFIPSEKTEGTVKETKTIAQTSLSKEVSPQVKDTVKVLIKSNTMSEIPTTGTTHTVAQGETLYAISKKYNTTVEQIRQKNNLIDNAIAIGQILIIF